jgi:hypothetical protein
MKLTMFWLHGALGTATVLASCTGLNQSSDQMSAAPRRDLSPIERSVLTQQLSAGLKDPVAAQFKWMPIALRERDGITDYCGLVNGRNSFGGYSGFVRFYAQLTKDEKGLFTKANLRAVEQPSRESNLFDPRWMNGVCEKFGYEDFGLAK